jgi:hypothetical protein
MVIAKELMFRVGATLVQQQHLTVAPFVYIYIPVYPSSKLEVTPVVKGAASWL